MDSVLNNVPLSRVFRSMVPSLKIVNKEKSALMRVLNVLLFFVPGFLTRYVTVLGSTIYAPGGTVDLGTLAHEVQHILDSKRFGWRYYVMYTFPQNLAVFAVFGFWWVWALCFLVFLLPWPAPGRLWIERRGYMVSAAHDLWVSDEKVQCDDYLERLDFYAGALSSRAYYWMWPFKDRNKAWLFEAMLDIKNLTNESLVLRGLKICVGR